jgi:glycosyltransferase involved in cell wall biosynthesis
LAAFAALTSSPTNNWDVFGSLRPSTFRRKIAALKFLFFSPHALTDSSSGAARTVQTLLTELKSLGHECLVVSGTIIDGPNHLFDQVIPLEPVDSYTIGGTDIKIPFRKVVFQNVEHLILGAKASNAGDLMAYEESVLRTLFVDAFDRFQPDILITYGGFTSNFFAGLYAIAKGRKSVLYAASDTYRKSSDFIHVQLVSSLSKALTSKIASATHLPIVTIPPMINRADVTCESRSPEFVTFINPRLDKGLKLAVAVARESLRRNKPYKFLFVESRGTNATALSECPELSECSNVAFAKNVSNVRAIYEVTRVLLFPSVWFETAGMVAIEANMNSIPVLASNVGGIPEMLDGAGYLFDPPAAMLADWTSPPPPNYLEQWLSVLDRLHENPAEFDSAVLRAQAADQRYNLRSMAQKFVDAVS